MIVKTGNTESTEIDDDVVKKILNFYPEEKLAEHRTFVESFSKGSITIKELKEASEKIHISWQLFFLNKDRLKEELENIEKNRADKFPKGVSFINKRKGRGKVTSKRIIDRQIRLQNFICSVLLETQVCDFVGHLKNKNIDECVGAISSYFNIDVNYFRSRKKVQDSLGYLINQIQSRNNVNISQGVLTNGMLPEIKNIRNIYKNTSGFVLQSKKMPFIFLPNEINPDENNYRQVYTLLYLIVVIGLDDFLYGVEGNFSFKKLKDDDKYKKINKIVSEFLLPSSYTDTLKTKEITKSIINSTKEKYKISYSAILFVLRLRSVIDSDVYKLLELPEKEPSVLTEVTEVVKNFNHPFLKTSVSKFCGDLSYGLINKAISGKKISPTQAQLLIFGRVRKNSYKEYIKSI